MARGIPAAFNQRGRKRMAPPPSRNAHVYRDLRKEKAKAEEAKEEVKAEAPKVAAPKAAAERRIAPILWGSVA